MLKYHKHGVDIQVCMECILSGMHMWIAGVREHEVHVQKEVSLAVAGDDDRISY